MVYIAIIKNKLLKRYFFLLILAVLPMFCLAKGHVALHGKIFMPVADSIYISYNNSRLAYDPVEIALHLNRDGSFSTTFDIPEKYTIVALKYGGRKSDLVAADGFDLELGAEGKRFDSTIHYKGEGSFIAGFVAAHAMNRGLMENYLVPMQPHFADTAPVFKKVLADLEQAEVSYLNEHMSGLPTDFVHFWVNYYHYYGYFAMLQYPLLHEMALQKTYYIRQVRPSNYAIVRDMPDLFNDSILYVPTYRMYLDQLYKMKLNADGYSNLQEGTESQRFRQDDSLVTLYFMKMLPLSMEYSMASLIYGNVRHQSIARTEHLLEIFRERWPGSEFITPIQQQLAIMKRLAKGEKAMDFTISTPQGAVVKLSELRGKVVLLCFWSGEYEQGVIDLKLTNKLFNRFKDSGAAFVFVSIDGNDQVWKAYIDKFKISGMHTHVNGWKSMLAELYGIQSVPTFFLIDKQGRFATDPGEVPLPRLGDALPNKIEQLLKE